MADPQLMSIDPNTGVARWLTADGAELQSAYDGLTPPLQSDYTQMLAQQYAAPVMQQPDNAPFQAFAPGEIDAQAQRDLMPFRATPQGAPVASPGTAPIQIDGQLGDRTQPARLVRSTRAPVDAPQPATQPAVGDDEFVTDFAAPAASPSGATTSPDDQPVPEYHGLSLNQMRILSKRLPGSRVGGSPGQTVIAQGPTQRQYREVSPGLAPAAERLAQARTDAAENQRIELHPILADADRIAAELETQARAEEQFVARRNDTAARRAADVQRERAKFDELSAQHIAAEQQGIDPDHYFASRSTSQRIMGAIGMLLGGVSAGLTGRENPAYKIMEDAIERDMIAQKENLSAKGRAAERQRGVMSDVAAIYDDEQAQADATRLALFRAGEAKIRQVEAITVGTEARARLTALGDEVAIKNAELEVALNESLSNSVTTSERPVTVGGSRGVDVDRVVKANDAGREQPGLQSYGAGGEHVPGELFVKAYQGNAPTRTEAQEMRQLAHTTNTYTSLMQKLITFRSSAGSMTDPQRRAAAEAIAAEAALVKKSEALAALGVLAGPDMDIINAAQGGDPTAILSFDTARYKQAIENARAAESDRQREIIIPVDPSTIPENMRRQPLGANIAARQSLRPAGQ